MSASKHVVVLGVRRSGTSLSAGLLAKLGYFLENNSRPPDRHNPEGYWESKRIQDLNAALLHRLGGWESQPPKMPTGWEASAKFSRERERAKLIVDSYRGHELWGMKDDRFSITLPLWKQALPSDVSYILCVRNPLAVFRSVSKMTNDPVESNLTFEAWLRYMGNGILSTQGARRLLVFYEEFQKDPQTQTFRFCDFLGMQRKVGLELQFKPELSHQQPSLQEFLDTKQASEETKGLYLALLDTHSGSTTLDDIGRSLKVSL